jgi:hypothetical protein
MNREIFYKNTWFDRYLGENGKIIIPENLTRIKFDVGLAGDAPNSALWLTEDNDTFVIAIEPLDYHWKHLEKLGSPDNNEDLKHPDWKIIQLGINSVTMNREILCNIGDRFLGLRLAINDVVEPEVQKFYLNKIGNTGSSSLREPLPQNFENFDKELEIEVCSLEFILDHLPWDKISYIEHIKTDCEGLDYQVVKSIGKYLNKIVYISSEYDNYSPSTMTEFIEFMQKNNFTLMKNDGGNMDFKNNHFDDEIKNKGIRQLTFGL